MSNANTVVLVGRMNVGKSTLFNRLAKDVRSITLDYEGVTRDFIKDTISWQGKTFTLIDSGGITLRKVQDQLLEKVRQKVLMLIETAGLVVFVLDGVAGVTAEDREIAQYLHKLGKQVIICVNKADAAQTHEQLYEFNALGYSSIVVISAQHGTGINDLLEMVVEQLPDRAPSAAEEKPTFKVVFLGKPNVGKSSLLNVLLKQERSIVSDVPGTTREAISESITFYKESIELTDTPGIRRKRSVSGELEPLMVKSSFAALKDADIIALLIDGSEHALVDQELKLAFYAFTDHYKALIILVNKQDLVTPTSTQDLERSFDYYKHLINKVPVLHISCITQKNIGRVVPTINELWQRYSQRFTNKELINLFIPALQQKPLFHQSQYLRVYDVEQVRTAPITIVLTVNEPKWFGTAQIGFFENLLRSKYPMQGVPVRFICKKAPEKS